MVHQVYLRARQCTSLDDVVIATDSPEVARVCVPLGDRVVLTGSEHENGTDRVAEAARSLAVDLVVNIQGDEPLIEPAVVDDLVDFMATHPGVPMGTVGSTTLTDADRESNNVVKVVGRNGLAVGFYRSQPVSPPEGRVMRHVGLYAYRRDFLFRFAEQPAGSMELENRLEQLRALEMGVYIGLIATAYEGVSVDTPEDLERVVTHWQTVSAEGTSESLKP